MPTGTCFSVWLCLLLLLTRSVVDDILLRDLLYMIFMRIGELCCFGLLALHLDYWCTYLLIWVPRLTVVCVAGVTLLLSGGFGAVWV